jgi:hypothetical protein
MSSDWDFGGGGSTPSNSGGLPPLNQPADTWSMPAAPSSAAPMTAPAPATASGTGRASAPVLWLGLAGLVVAVAVGLNVASSSWHLAVVGWLLAGPVAVGLFAVFVLGDTKRRADPWYAASDLVDWGRRVLVLAILVAVALNAWTFADAVGRGKL